MSTGRTIAIGDIHGCSRALAALLDAVEPRAADTIVTLGDHIDRGPDSRGVLDRLLRLGRECQCVPLVGNHEEMFAEALRDKSAIEKWLRCGGTDTLRSYGWKKGGGPRPLRDWFPEEHRQFLATGRSYHQTPTHVFVHGGCCPTNPWTASRPSSCAGAIPTRPRRGHTSLARWWWSATRRSLRAKCWTSGSCYASTRYCFRGGWLTAVAVDSGQVWQTDLSGRRRADPPTLSPMTSGR